MTWKERAEHNHRVAHQYREYFEDASEPKMKVVLSCEQLAAMLAKVEGIETDVSSIRRKVQDAIILIEEGRPHWAIPILQEVLTLIGKP